MSDEQQGDQAPALRPEKKHWEMTGREKLLWMRAQREAHRFPVRPIEDHDNASGDDEYDPFAR